MQDAISTEQRSTGFTLIELLIVISIISVLAAILFPVFARARENARRTSCMSNLKQIGLGVLQYTQDYDEHYPLAWWGVDPNNPTESFKQTDTSMPGYQYQTYGVKDSVTVGRWITWQDLIYPYVKSSQIFRCPSFNETSATNKKGFSYGMSNAYNNASQIYGGSGSDGSRLSTYGMDALNGGIPLSAINHPAEAAMVYEVSSDFTVYSLSGRNGLIWAAQRESKYLERHLGGVNFTFGDGHAKWLSSAQIFAATGTNASSACSLTSVKEDRAYCSKLWNPFLP